MRTSRQSPCAGFTLVEVLVVLAILAALSTIALRSADSLQKRARYEGTRNTLEQIEMAFFGSRSGIPGEVRAGGLVADTGLYLSETETDPTLRFVSLLRQPGGVALSQFAPDPLAPGGGDSGVHLASGWRGPYIRTPTGATSSDHIEDGWGNPIHADYDSTTSSWTIVSAGADGLFGSGTEYDADVSLTLPGTALNAMIAGNVNIELTDSPLITGDYYVQVFAFEPDPSNGNVLAIGSTPAPSSSTLVHSTDFPLSVGFNFSGANALSTGPRIVRAYLVRVDDVPTPSDAEMRTTPPMSTSHHTSALVSLNLLHGAQNLDLTIDR